MSSSASARHRRVWTKDGGGAPDPSAVHPLAVPELPESVVHANHWHFFRNFLDDAHPAYTPEELERYVEAWSQPGQQPG